MLSDNMYYRPTTIEDALDALSSSTAAVIAAGCTDLFPLTTAPQMTGHVLDVTGIKDMRGITDMGDIRRIGGATTWTDIVRADLPPAYDMLKLAAREIGSIQIQNVGTIAGNLCNASPAADSIPCLLALDASVELTSTAGRRQMLLSDFLLGPRKTMRQPDEIMTAIMIPKSAESGVSAFEKLGTRKYLIISIVMAAARMVITDNRITQAALSLGSCSPVAVRLHAVEQALIGTEIHPASGLSASDLVAASDVEAVINPIDDVRGSASYRIQAATTLLHAAIDHCLISATRQPESKA
jgi:CO/xanthine dehydrogenase FAD-binding subunit